MADELDAFAARAVDWASKHGADATKKVGELVGSAEGDAKSLIGWAT